MNPVDRLLPILLAIGLLAVASGVTAQGPYFRNLNLPGELESADIAFTEQSADGFLWIGADRGLFRYDGVEFRNYQLDDHPGRQSVTALYSRDTDTIWVGYQSGGIAHLVNGELGPFEPEEGNPSRKITDFARDGKGRLWYSSYGEGLYVYDGNRVYNINTEDGLSDNYVYCLETAPDGTVWAGSDKGINICSFENRVKTIRHIGSRQGLPDNIVTDLGLWRDSLMYAGMYKEGVCAVDIASGRIERLMAPGQWTYGTVLSFAVLPGELWIATEQRKLVQFVRAPERYFRTYGQEDGLPEDGPRQVSLDDEGNIWIVSGDSRLTKVNLLFEIIEQHEGIPFTNIHSLLADSRGHLWFFNGDELICHNIEFTGKNIARRYDLPLGDRMQIISLCEDDLGYIWAGTFGDGAYRIDPSDGSFIHVGKDEGLVDDNILGMTASGDRIWFATLGGASFIRSVEVRGQRALPFTTIGDTDGLGNNYVYSVYADKRGNTWFATDGNGLVRYDGSSFSTYSEATGSIGSSVVYSVTGDAEGHIWFSTPKDGIYRFDGDSFMHFGLENGLSDLNISSLVTDERNNLIITHRRGVDILHIPSGRFYYYSDEYGLDDIYPDLNTVSIDPAGSVWIGTRKAVIKYTPPDAQTRKQPLTILERPTVYLESFDFNARNKLRAGLNHLTFRYSGIWFQHPTSVTYQYRLSGYDPDWVTTRDRSVIYPNLPPGHYTFSVRSSSGPNFEGAAAEEFRFSIRPPFWKTWWFTTFAVLAAGSVLYLLFTSREKRLRRRAQREKERVLLEFDNLKSQVNPHFLFNSFNSLISVIEEDRDEAVEYVEKLSRFFRNILTYRDRELITVAEELDIVEDYFFIHRQRYGRLVVLEIDVPEADREKMIPPLTLQILIENAIKHNVISNSHPLTISVRSLNGHLEVRNRIRTKRTREPSTGTGLMNIRNRYRLLSGQQVTVSEGPEEFVVRLPLLTKQFQSS